MQKEMESHLKSRGARTTFLAWRVSREFEPGKSEEQLHPPTWNWIAIHLI